MGFTFTENQNKVLQARGHNVLVSAAAGSGKTAVLVERIIRMITEGEHPMDIDRLLVVTFTRAAAAEMRERIAKAVTERLALDPENRHLQKQETLLHHAQITTIDSFCSFLLRNSFSAIGLDPGFRQMDETENALLEQDVMEDFLDAEYASHDPDIEMLNAAYSQGTTDSSVPKLIFLLLHTALSHPWGDAWLEERKKDYDVKDVGDLLSRPWMQQVLDGCVDTLRSTVSLYEAMQSVCEKEEGLAPYGRTAADEGEFFARCLKKAESAEGRDRYDVIREAATYPFGKIGSLSKKAQIDEDLRKRAKALRDLAKANITQMRDRYFTEKPEETVRRMQAMQPVLSALIRLTLSYHGMLQDKKKEKNVISFADLEQLALEILLTRNDDGTYTERPEAESYRQYFDEILIDEYQDSNEVQELLLSAVSGESKGRYARFMVGDVKQSIYRFRNARPEIFEAKYESYLPGDAKTERIDLDQNFRSREEVLDIVNLIFRKIMRKEIGGVDYTDREALKKGAVYPEPDPGKNPYRAELLLVETQEKTGKDSGEEKNALTQSGEEEESGEDEIAQLSSRKKEALAIAKKIRELTSTLMVTDRETGQQRKCQYRDIVILIRSTTGADAYRQIFDRENIPLYMEGRTGYFSAEEVREVMQILRIIQNPRQDIPLYGALRGYFGGFSEDEIGRMRGIGWKMDRDQPEENRTEGLLYDSLLLFLSGTEDANAGLRARLRSFLDFMSGWREKAEILPIHELLTELVHATGFLTYVTALPAGAQRRANVEELIVIAKNFEQTAYSGVFAFLRYIDEMHQYEVDQGEAGTLDSNADVVRIMTIHKSKGLEFPVCFVAGLSSKYSFSRDTSGPVITDSDLGLGADYISLETRSAAPTLRKSVVAGKIKRDSLGEELRVLYVAATRAKEKLILTAAVKDVEKLLSKERTALSAFDAIPGREEHLPPSVIEKSGNYLDLILLSVFGRARELGIEEESAGNSPLLPIRISLQKSSDLSLMEKEDQLNAGARAAVLQGYRGMDPGKLPDRELADVLEKSFSFRYPHENLRDLYTKTSVSDLKHEAMEEKGLTEAWEGEGAKEMFPEKDADIPEPVYVVLPGEEEKSGEKAGEKRVPLLRGAARGTAIHRGCELIPYRRWQEPARVTAEEFTAFVEELLAEDKIPPEYGRVLLPEDFLPFLQSDIAGRMAEAARTGHLKREQPFVFGLPADEVDKNFPHGETILIQGIIDAFFIERGEDGTTHAVVVDYKTDHVRKAQELVDLYQKQLDLYAQALEGMLGIPVQDRIIYSFALKQEIRLP